MIAITRDHTTVTNGDGSTMTMIYDAPNLYSWSSFRTDANSQGTPTYQIGTTDGGGTWQNEYDVSRTQSWSTRMTVTNAAHQVVSQTTVNDNNTLTVVANDVSNAYSWSTFTMQYTWDVDTGWNYSSTSGVNDNGTTNLDMNQVWNSFDTLLWYSSPYVVTQGSLGGGDDGLPVILDLDGNGVDVTPLGSSSAFYNMDGGSGRIHTAWVGGNDGLLAIDLASNGRVGPDDVIDQAKEIAFSAWAPGSTSDMAALRQVFDTDRDGELSAGDERWDDFRIWQDSNGDGISQFSECISSLISASLRLTSIRPATQRSCPMDRSSKACRAIPARMAQPGLRGMLPLRPIRDGGCPTHTASWSRQWPSMRMIAGFCRARSSWRLSLIKRRRPHSPLRGGQRQRHDLTTYFN